MNSNAASKYSGLDFKVYLDMKIPEHQRTSVRRYFGEELTMISPMIFSISDPDDLESELKLKGASSMTLLLFILESYDEVWVPVCKLALKTIGNVLVFTKKLPPNSSSHKQYSGINKCKDRDFFGTINFQERSQKESLFSCFSGCSSHPDDYKRSFQLMSSSVFEAIERIKENEAKRQLNIRPNTRGSVLISRATSGHFLGKEETESHPMKEKRNKNQASLEKDQRPSLEKPKLNFGCEEKDKGKKIEMKIMRVNEEKSKRKEHQSQIYGPKKNEESSLRGNLRSLENGSVSEISLSIKE